MSRSSFPGRHAAAKHGDRGRRAFAADHVFETNDSSAIRERQKAAPIADRLIPCATDRRRGSQAQYLLLCALFPKLHSG